MASKDQVKAQVRFALSQLRAQNGHHAFEELCRHLARARIALNILPATGPVAAGGDQGRDFETFRTYLAEPPMPSSAFKARTSDKDVVFICTLQVEDLESKIRKDLTKITGSGEHPAAVYVFSEADLEVAKRHRLQDDVRQRYEIRLEVLDGNAIAEHLSDRDTFWIAERYLHIPADIYPREPGAAAWYEEAREEWKRRGKPEPTHGDFADLKRATRHATFEPLVVQDLPVWIDLLGGFRSQDAAPKLQRAAVYEIAVASLVGLQTLGESEQDLDGYFNYIPQTSDPIDIQDAAILVLFLQGGLFRGLLGSSGVHFSGWKATVLDKATLLLGRSDSLALTPADRCMLMESIGLLKFPANPAELEDGSPQALDETFKWWFRLLREAEQVPLFPLGRMAKYVGQIAPLLSDHPRYPELTQRLDELTSKRAGKSAAAESCRDRAVSLRKAGRLVAALREFHRAKIEWFTGDTVRGTFLSMGLIGHCYEDLGLLFAARYYYMAVAWGALNVAAGEHKDLTAKLVWPLANTTYQQGAWMSFFDWTRVAVAAHSNLSADPYDLSKYPEFERTLAHLSVATAYARRFLPRHVAKIEGRLRAMGLAELVDEFLKETDGYFERESNQQLLGDVCRELKTVPFNDAGHIRSVSWTALGVLWRVSFSSDYPVTLAAERFAAVAQIVAADLADRELCLLKTDVEVDLGLGDGSAPLVSTEPSNKGRRWSVRLTPWNSSQNAGQREQVLAETIGAIVAILHDVSLLPEARFKAEIERLFKAGITDKINSVNLYDRLYSDLVPPDRYAELDRANADAPDSRCEVSLPEHPELAWRTVPGPIYSGETLKGLLRRRYEVLNRTLAPLLPHLLSDETFRAVVHRLRTAGWKDWQLLMAIQNTALSLWARQHRSLPSSPDVALRLLEREFLQGRFPAPSQFDEQELRMARQVGMMGSLNAFGLELHEKTPDLPALEEFLGVRYQYWSDDVSHPDAFGPAFRRSVQ